MAFVVDWFRGFTIRHMDRHPRADWPVESVEFFDGWRRLLVAAGADEADADEASRRMMGEPQPWVADHPHTHARLVKEVQAERMRAGRGIAPNSREEALSLSRHCDARGCNGSGLCLVPVPEHLWDRFRDGTAPAHCTCPMGRWLKRLWDSKRSEWGRPGVFDAASPPAPLRFAEAC